MEGLGSWGKGVMVGMLWLGTLLHPAQASPKRITFYCGTSQGAPATLVRSGNRVVPIIRWTSDAFAESGYSNERRCQEVSRRFQAYYDDGSLSFITTGRMNGQNVICVARSHGGPCAGLLFTLKPGTNPTRVINQLFNIRTRASGPLNETTARPYVDFNEFLQEAEGSEPTP
ncbi:MAG: COP23 domain-containing protein [Gloeomargarita sp. SKYBB_i_bin120]|nr:COP23 domain-containing protein [Gloeomargarita sp. SKYG98]MCS7293170.1 COP23 domain-containing protein [Gloeomargarita sp. SKYB120]MDW8178735.1 COP23 domain-containing protein [Gloeomargarita sp. SKYBB_i_bin120]